MVLAGSSPSLAEMGVCQIHFPIHEAPRRNQVAPGHKFGDPLVLSQERKNIKYKTRSCSLKETTLNFLGMVPGIQQAGTQEMAAER